MLEEHRELVRRRLVRLSGSSELAKDLAQQVWQRAWTSWPNYNDTGRSANWLMTICKSVWADHCRLKSRRPPTEPLPQIEDLEDRRGRLVGDTTKLDVLSMLGEDDAQLASLLYRGWTYSEVAAFLGYRAKSSLVGRVVKLRKQLRWLRGAWRPRVAAAASGAAMVALLVLASRGSFESSSDSPHTTVPAVAPIEGVVEFVSLEADDPEIYLAAADGSWLRRITRRPGADESPSLAPDGLLLAYASWRVDRWHLVVAAIDQTSTRSVALPTTVTAVEGIAWTADGDLLVGLASENHGALGGCELYLVRATGQIEQVTASERLETHFPSSRSRGDFLVQRNVPRAAASSQIWGFDLGTKELVQLTNTRGGHYWPAEYLETDGTSRLLSTNRELFGPQLDNLAGTPQILGEYYEGYATTTPGRPGEVLVASTPFRRTGPAPSSALARSAYASLRR